MPPPTCGGEPQLKLQQPEHHTQQKNEKKKKVKNKISAHHFWKVSQGESPVQEPAVGHPLLFTYVIRITLSSLTCAVCQRLRFAGT